ncbi:MAG TPA: hypothetical protein VNE71_15540 [Myxococcota bacterium]|nr:hypothetical protein [Myxococcota bacterium]
MEAPPKPIVSRYAEDPAFDERIDRFVVGLGERVDAFQDAERLGDRIGLATLAGALRSEADALGYPPLSEAAGHVAASCSDPSPDALRKSVFDLTEVTQRVRRGHRSAAS